MTARNRESAREWLRGWVIDKYRLLEILDGESGEKMIDGLATLLDEKEDTMKWRDVVVTAERERDEARSLVSQYELVMTAEDAAIVRDVQLLERERDEARAELAAIGPELDRARSLAADMEHRALSAEAEVERLRDGWAEDRRAIARPRKGEKA
jgi:hypothetical protein